LLHRQTRTAYSSLSGMICPELLMLPSKR
jgi:hypothetical protein